MRCGGSRARGRKCGISAVCERRLFGFKSGRVSCRCALAGGHEGSVLGSVGGGLIRCSSGNNGGRRIRIVASRIAEVGGGVSVVRSSRVDGSGGERTCLSFSGRLVRILSLVAELGGVGGAVVDRR